MVKGNAMSFGNGTMKGFGMNFGKGMNMGKGKGSNNMTLTGIILVSAVFIFAILIANKEMIQEGFFNSEKKYSVEYYYMDTCGHCIDFNETGIWDRLKAMSFNNVSLKKYNRSEHIERVNALGITGFPAIIVVDNTASGASAASAGSPTILASFEEARTYDKLLQFIKKYDEM